MSALPSDEVHVWRCALDSTDVAGSRLEATLEPHERERADRFRFCRDRRRYVTARAALREILGNYLDTPPDALRFAYGPRGKPRLEPESPGEEIRFNLAHSDGLAVYAFTRGRAVGIDVERVRPDVAGEGIERRFFSAAEAEAVTGAPEESRAEAFFGCWTSKEAYVKARGDGLALALDAFTMSTRASEKLRLLSAGQAGETERWVFERFTPAAGFVGALAVEGDGWRARYREHRIS